MFSTLIKSLTVIYFPLAGGTYKDLILPNNENHWIHHFTKKSLVASTYTYTP